MPSTTGVLGLALLGGAWLSLVLTGCSGPQLQQTDALSAWAPSQPPKSIAEKPLDPLLAKVSQLQVTSHESFTAAKSIGRRTKLTAARHNSATAEQLLHEGQAAYSAKQYELGRDKLRAADAAFRRAEEAAVRAGLRQLEDELATEYRRLLNPDAHSGRRIVSAARVSQGSLNLRDGAGTHFPVIGPAQPSDTLTILAELGEWYQVRTGTGLVGWVAKMSVTPSPEPLRPERAIETHALSSLDRNMTLAYIYFVKQVELTPRPLKTKHCPRTDIIIDATAVHTCPLARCALSLRWSHTPPAYPKGSNQHG